jgi:hypothetical protein
MTRTSERTTVTSEAVPRVTLTLSADRGYHGTALGQITKAPGLRIPNRHNHTQSKYGLLPAPAPGRRYPPRPCWPLLAALHIRLSRSRRHRSRRRLSSGNPSW